MSALMGTGVALITPFTSQGTVDVAALERVVAYQVENGIDYLVILGTTGESVTLSKEEKDLVIATVKKANNGKLPMVLGIGGNNTQAILEEISARDLSDFEAILSVSPAYNRPTQEGIYQHFKAVSEACPIPIILYNVPGRTASNVLPETLVRLANDCSNVIAVKEAANDIVQAMRMIDETPDGFLVISGDDILALPMTLAGGAGVISVIGQGFPKEFSQMIRLGLNREVDAAYALHYKLTPCIGHIFAEGNPAGIKAVFKKLGICEDHVRLPLVGISPELRSKIDEFVDGL